MKKKEEKVGIEDITFAIPKYYISAKELAEYRNIDPYKYTNGIGIEKISILKDESLIKLSAKSLNNLIIRNDLDIEKDISRIYIATESSADESRSLAEFVLEESEKEFGMDAFSHISPPIELKQACISSSVGLENLCRYTRDTGKKSILLIADEAIYGLGSSGEPTQGAGCIAILIGKNPSLLELSFNNCGYYNKPVYDFYRPTGDLYPTVDGKYSNFIYLYCMRNAYNDFVNKNNQDIECFDYFCFHIPYPKMAKYATASLLIHHYRGSSKFKKIEEKIGNEPLLLNGGSLESMKKDKTYLNKYFDYNKKFRETDLFNDFFNKKVKPSTRASSVIGNVYSGSLYLALGSLIEYGKTRNNSNIGFGAFSSGASSMVFYGKLKKRKDLSLGEQIVYREKISIEEYEKSRMDLKEKNRRTYE